MAVQIVGNGGVVAEVDGDKFRAQRVTSRPIDHGALGHYRIGAFSGLVTAHAANSELFQFRWSDATRFCIPTYLHVRETVTTAPTVAQEFGFEVIRALAWTADGTGGTPISNVAAGGGKLRSSFPSSLIGATSVRIATTAALGAGTKTLDAVGMASRSVRELAAAATVPSQVLEAELDFNGGSGQQHPLVLAQNEGFVIRSTIATVVMVVRLHVTLSWAEVASY